MKPDRGVGCGREVYAAGDGSTGDCLERRPRRIGRLRADVDGVGALVRVLPDAVGQVGPAFGDFVELLVDVLAEVIERVLPAGDGRRGRTPRSSLVRPSRGRRSRQRSR